MEIGTHGSISKAYYADWYQVNWGLGTSTSGYKGTSFNKSYIPSLASSLGSNYFTNDTKGINDGYPILKWELEIEN